MDQENNKKDINSYMGPEETPIESVAAELSEQVEQTVTTAEADENMAAGSNPSDNIDTPEPVSSSDIDTAEQTMHKATPMFVRINQVVTSLISGVFASLIILLAVIGVSQAGLDLQSGSLDLNFQMLLIAMIVFACGITLSQVLDSYLSKLVERESFEKIGFKIFKNLSSQLILLILSVPFLFLSLGFENKVALIFLGNYLIFSYVLFSQILFFGHNYRQLGSVFGLFLSATIINIMIFNLESSLVPVLFLLSPPLISTLRELGAQVVEGLSSFEI